MAAIISSELKGKVRDAYTSFDRVITAQLANPLNKKSAEMKMIEDLTQAVASLIGAFNALISDNETR